MKKELLKFNTEVLNNEIDLFPLYNGLAPSAMGLNKLPTEIDPNNKRTFTFLIHEDSFHEFRKSKELCREERLDKYYQTLGENFKEINEHIIRTLIQEYPEHFELKDRTLLCSLTNEEISFNEKYELTGQKTNLKVPFVDLFDALAMQVSEDLVIHKVPDNQLNPLKKEEDKRDYASSIHLCHCNGWTAEWAINQTFDFIHEGVPRISKIIPNSTRMMLSFLKGTKFERIAAISFKTTPFLNRHDDDYDLWNKPFDKSNPFLNIRVERQTVTGFKNDNAFLFTIRTFLYDVNLDKSNLPKELKHKRLHSLYMVFNKLPKNSYAYETIKKLKERDVMGFIKDQMNRTFSQK